MIYGIDECSKGTPKKERLNNDLDKVTSIITQEEIRDILRLGKYHEQLKQPCPLLVKLNRSSDVPVLLSKARSLPKNT